jgi:hypothetical protein
MVRRIGSALPSVSQRVLRNIGRRVSVLVRFDLNTGLVREILRLGFGAKGGRHPEAGTNPALKAGRRVWKQKHHLGDPPRLCDQRPTKRELSVPKESYPGDGLSLLKLDD